MTLWERIKTEPTILLSALQALLGLLVVFGALPFTEDEQAGIMATAGAVLSLIIAISVRQFAWPLLMAVVQALVPLALEFGVNWTDVQVGAVYTFFAVLGAFFVRQKVTPETKLPALAPPGR
jgi:hypothetical protein